MRKCIFCKYCKKTTYEYRCSYLGKRIDEKLVECNNYKDKNEDLEHAKILQQKEKEILREKREEQLRELYIQKEKWEQDGALKCPECGCYTYSLKRYTLPYLYVNCLIFWSKQDAQYTCCPKCMRKHILLCGFTYNILTFHVWWPISIFPWMLFRFFMSFEKGHSESVIKEVESFYFYKGLNEHEAQLTNTEWNS